MFGSLGIPEIVFILFLALLVFGPRKLPEVGRTIGRALGEFRRATGDLKRTFDREVNAFEDETKLETAASPRQPAVPGPEVPAAAADATDAGDGSEADAGSEAGHAPAGDGDRGESP